ncbi:DNA polymerase III subunit beta family protein [Pseudonocardia nigra]|uniref:DNA polymerase III subunit beta family protein n=1 Tax=Pseudonocardia nigra TaxID=1921578 RepID=UPI001C5DC928|nr:MerR family transcriptional regulator [Pseudonocardia nigra]
MGADYGIGRMSRESGLTVSALRFYDGAGVLSPAHVDPRTGYRFYAADQLVVARLVATLRRVGMPLAGIREVLAVRHDAAAVDVLLTAHLRRLEQGLADARRALSSVPSLLAPEEHPVSPTTVTVRGPAFVEALRAVRFAVGADPELPVLGGVLLDIEREAVTLVATDRYRLALSPAPVVALDGPPAAVVVPAGFADRIPGTGTVSFTIDGSTITARAGDEVFDAALIPDAFPDYRRLLPTDMPRRVLVDDALRTALAAAPTRTMRRESDGAEYEVVMLDHDTDGGITVDAGDEGIGVNREFLFEALEAGGEGQLVLSLDGPITPLMVWSVSERSISMLMPVRL